jgi:hypothetical protein
VQTQEQSARRWPLRLIAAAPSCLVSAIFVATQIPAVREAIGITKTIYRFINSTVPSLGIAAIWAGFALLVGGVVAAWWFRRSIKEDTAKMMAVGSAVLAVALGGLVAVVSTLNQPSVPAAGTYHAETPTTHHRVVHHHHRRRPDSHRPPSGGTKPASSTGSTPSIPASTPPSTPAPSSSPAPAGSASGDSGGNNNTVTVEKNNHQTATSGNATGENAKSGEAKNENNEGPVIVTIG